MEHSALLELLESLKAAGVDSRIRLAAQNMQRELIDTEACGVIGAGPGERNDFRTRIRNGSRGMTPRGLQLVIVNAPASLNLRLAGVLLGLTRQRRRVHHVDLCLTSVSQAIALQGGDSRLKRSAQSQDLKGEVHPKK